LNGVHDENCMKIITISKIIADVNFGWKESAFVGQESEHDSAETEALCCDGGATSSLSSSFLNCTACYVQSPSRQLKAAL
jgi:hypothetical protein